MDVNSSPFIWLGAIFFFILMYHVITSAWLNNSSMFYSTLVFGALSFLCFAIESNGVKDFLIFGFIYMFFFYAFSLKYITNTAFLDLTYQSHSRFKEYLMKKEEISNFERFILRLGPALGITMIIYVAYEIFNNLL